MYEPYVFFDDLGEDDEATEVRASEIDTSTNGDDLDAWLTGFERVEDNIIAEVKARILCGTATEDWLHRVGGKLGYTGRAISQIKRRLKVLGLRNPHVEHIGKLDLKIAFLKSERAFGNAFIWAAGEVLTPAQMAEIGRMARDKMEDDAVPVGVAA